MTELEFSRRLRQYRKDREMTQQELADRLGVSNKSVSRWESGSYPDVALLGPLARALGVTVDDLLNKKAPVRTLTKTDWQNVLSFAFALGGGILFFGLNAFVPAPVSYLLYIAAMAYGIYLQQHYTYHSKWFHVSNLVMNFFVNWRLYTAMLALIYVLYSNGIIFGGPHIGDFEGYSRLITFLSSPVIRVSAVAGLTLITAVVIFCKCRKKNPNKRKPEDNETKAPLPSERTSEDANGETPKEKADEDL